MQLFDVVRPELMVTEDRNPSPHPPCYVCGDGTDTLKVDGLIKLQRHDAESQWFITGDSCWICAVLLQRRLSYRLQHIKVKLHSSWLTNIKQNIKTAAFCTNWWHFFDLCSYIWPCVLKKMLSASTSSFVLWFHSRWVCICNKGGGWWGWWGIWEAFWDWICDFPLGSNSGQTLSAFMQIRKGQLKALKHTRDNSACLMQKTIQTTKF